LSNNDLELWKRRRLLEMQKRLLAKKTEEEKGRVDEEGPQKEKVEAREVLKRILVGRAMEVWDLACRQYPDMMKRLEAGLTRMVLSGEITEPLDEGQLLYVLRTMGLNIRFDVKIRILEDGRFKTISEKLKEE